MDVNSLFDQIKNKLIVASHLDKVRDLERLIDSGATSLEILSSTGKYLLDLKSTNLNVYVIIENEVEDYLNYCKMNGLLIK